MINSFRYGSVYSSSRGLLFDGVNERVSIDGLATSAASDTVATMSMWIRPTDITPSSYQDLFSFGDTDANEFLRVRLMISTGYIQVLTRIAGTNQFSVNTDTNELTQGVWSHVAIVQDGTEVKIYVDGSDIASTFTVTTDKTVWINDFSGIDNCKLAYRSNNSSTGNYYAGRLDEVAYFNTDFTSGEITELYNSGCPDDLNNHSQSGALVSWWAIDADDDATSSIADKAGSNTGTPQNMESEDLISDVVC